MRGFISTSLRESTYESLTGKNICEVLSLLLSGKAHMRASQGKTYARFYSIPVGKNIWEFVLIIILAGNNICEELLPFLCFDYFIPFFKKTYIFCKPQKSLTTML